jgi:bifunctional NMN adenylyltransferase/nudix hydrolase
MDTVVKKTDIGVVIGRFQVHELHDGHHDLIKTVMQHHDKVVILLGVSPAKSTKNNPLDFKSRELMLHESYPDLTILPIYDVHNDEEWSRDLDKKIREVFSIGSVTLYGSRDGFIPFYRGNFPTVELEARYKVSGSEIRKSLSHKLIADKGFRHGIIYASHDKYPTSYTTVDAAILDGKGQVLLGRKKNDLKGKWRFVGGFVDINLDANLEEAVKREVMEETGSLGVGEPIYVGSSRIDDWRYKNEQDGIMTTLFIVPYVFGSPKASDDIDDLKWFDINKLVETEAYQMVEEHKVLFNLLKGHLNRAQKNKGE